MPSCSPSPCLGVSDKERVAGTSMMWLFYETQYEILRSRTIAEEVIDRLQLAEDPNFAPQRQTAPEASAEPWFGIDWRDWIPERWREAQGGADDNNQRRAELVEQLQRNLVISGGKRSKIIQLSFDARDPALAARVANAVAAAYINFNTHARRSEAQENTAFLDNQLEELRARMEESEKKLQDYRRREGLLDSASADKLVASRLAGLTSELVRAQSQRSEAEIRYEQVKGIGAKRGNYESLGPVLQNALVLTLKEEYARLGRRVSELSERYGPKHPKMIAAESDLKEARRRLDQEIDKVVDSVRKEHEVAAAQERRIGQLVEKHKAEIRGLRGKEFQLSNLEREVENSRRVYETFLAQLQETDVKGDYDVSNIRVVDPATPPVGPVKPRKARIIAASLVFGVFLGIGLAFLRERLDDSFHTGEEVEERLQLPLLGILPLNRRARRRRTAERLVRDERHSPFAEAVNHIRTAILFAGLEDVPQVVLVTSATSGEGKSTLVANLSTSFAQIGTTLLVEADLRKPRLSQLWGLEGRAGLTELLAGKCSQEDAIVRDPDEKNLFLLPAGFRVANPLEYLSSNRFRELLVELRSEYRYIVIDATPLLPVSDSIVLGHLADANVLLVRAEHTGRRMVQDALRRLRQAHIRPLGVVLAQADLKRMAYYGGHYYHYDASYYGYAKGEQVSDTPAPR